MIHHLFILFFAQVQQITSQTITCHNASQCVGDSIISASFQQIECSGYRSCLNATQIETNRGGLDSHSIGCFGSYSCFNAQTIQRNVTTDGEIWCTALFSCAFVNNLYNEKGVVSCEGEQSCRGSTITLHDTTATNEDHLQCWGDHSCMDATVTTRDRALLFGLLSGENSVFYSNDTTVKYFFSGSQSGYNAEIVCGIGHTCSVFCQGNGCNKLTLSCSDGSNASCTFNVNCVGAEKSNNNNVCPNGM